MKTMATIRARITKLIEAAQEQAFAGSAPPEDQALINRKLSRARATLERIIFDKLQGGTDG